MLHLILITDYNLFHKTEKQYFKLLLQCMGNWRVLVPNLSSNE